MDPVMEFIYGSLWGTLDLAVLRQMGNWCTTC